MRFDFLELVGAIAFICMGCHQFYLRKNVDRLERQGKVTPEAAVRIRKKPMALIGCILVLAGLGFLALGLFGV
jgi:hypothetical protein